MLDNSRPTYAIGCIWADLKANAMVARGHDIAILGDGDVSMWSTERANKQIQSPALDNREDRQSDYRVILRVHDSPVRFT